ncbi:MAG: RNA methyltransferase [Gemmatimonadaceae bacterium]
MRVLTLARDLRRRKARERDALFVVEGVRAVEELLRSPLEIVGVLAAPKLAESERGTALRQALLARAATISDVTDREFASATETDSPQGVLAVARIPERSLDPLRSQTSFRLLVLDAVQDPGNVGTIVRTAAALGATATVALPGTVDLWNAKVVRSAMGAHFHHLALHVTGDHLRAFLSETNTELWGADARGEELPSSAPARLAIAVGNEGAGLTDSVRDWSTRRIALPTTPMVESLNVAVATGILLYELRQ